MAPQITLHPEPEPSPVTLEAGSYEVTLPSSGGNTEETGKGTSTLLIGSGVLLVIGALVAFGYALPSFMKRSTVFRRGSGKRRAV